MMRRADGEPITSGDVMPPGRCQPPVNAMALLDRLGPEELRRVVRCMIIWAPEVFELGLERVSGDRMRALARQRELLTGGDR